MFFQLTRVGFEAAGLQDTLGHIADKKAQVQRIQANTRGGAPTPV